MSGTQKSIPNQGLNPGFVTLHEKLQGLLDVDQSVSLNDIVNPAPLVSLPMFISPCCLFNASEIRVAIECVFLFQFS